MPVILKSTGGGSVSLTSAATAVDVNITVPATTGTLATADGLASSSGASLVGYLPAGTGAVATNVQSVLRRWILVSNKGVNTIPGTTDMTTAIQNAINDAAVTGGDVIFDPQIYLFANLTIPANVTLRGSGLDSTYLKTATTGVALQLTTSVSHRVQIIGITLEQTGSVQGKGLAGTDCYWLNTEFFHVTGFVDNLYLSKSIYHSHKQLFSENSTNGVNYYGSTGVWNSDWFNNVLTFDTCRFSSCAVTGAAIKGCEVVFINPDFSGMAGTGAIGLKVYGDSSTGNVAHGIKLVTPYIESTDIGLSFSYAYVEIDAGFIQGGPSSGAPAATSIIDVDNSIVRWNGKPRDQDYFDFGWRLTNSSTLICESTLSGSVKASNTVDATSFIAQTFQGTFTATLTGCTTAPTVTGRYVVNQGQVTLSIPANTATSNSTSCTITGLPAGINPTRDQIVTGALFDNGVEILGAIRLATSGTIVLSKGAYGTAFLASGTKGHREITLSYQLT